MKTLKTLWACLILTLIGVSLFSLLVAPYEIYKTVSAHKWKPVKVKIVTNQILERQNRFYPHIRIKDQETGKISQKVSVRYGDITLSFVFFGGLMGSNLYEDRDKYPVGTVVTAFRSPNNSYVLEQNSPKTMLMMISCALAFLIFILYRARTPVQKTN